MHFTIEVLLAEEVLKCKSLQHTMDVDIQAMEDIRFIEMNII